MFIGSEDAPFRECLLKCGGLEREDVLWMDLTCPKIEDHWRDALAQQGDPLAGMTRARVLVPSTEDPNRNWPFLFETLCRFLRAAWENGLEFGYLIQSQEPERSREQLSLFIRRSLLGKATLGKVFRYEGEVAWWSPEELKYRFACEGAKERLITLREAEDAPREPPLIAEEIVPWREDPFQAFQQALQGAVEAVGQELGRANLGRSPQALSRQLGSPRRTSFDARILRGASPENLDALRSQDRKGHRDTFFLMSPAILPLDSLESRLRDVARLAPLFYRFTSPERGRVPAFHMDPDPGHDSRPPALQESGLGERLQSPLWHPLPGLPGLSQELIEVRNRLLVLGRTRGKSERKEPHRQAMVSLDGFCRRLRDLVDAETRHFQDVAPATLLGRSPYPFWMAYCAVWERLMYPFLVQTPSAAVEISPGQQDQQPPLPMTTPLITALWGVRWFPRFFPAPFFRRSKLFEGSMHILSQLIRLMDLYQLLFVSILRFRETLHRCYCIFDGLCQTTPLLERQAQNIMAELSELAKPTIRVENLEERLEQVLPPADNRADPESILEEAMKDTRTWMTASNEGILELSRQSRAAGFVLPEGDSSYCWIPAYFQFNEAWATARKMQEDLLAKGEFMDHLPFQDQTGRYEYRDRSVAIEEQDGRKDWVEWKKLALSKAERPLREDIHAHSRLLDSLRSSGKSGRFEVPESLISRGLEIGFFLERATGNERRIGLSLEVFYWVDEDVRTRFYQHRSGLDRHSFKKRWEDSTERALLPWIAWARERAGGPVQPLSIGLSAEEVYASAVYLDDSRLDPDRHVHPYFGTPRIQNGRFLLSNALDGELMRFQKPVSREDGETRFFPPAYLYHLFRRRPEILENIIRVFFSFCDSRDRDPYELLEIKQIPWTERASG